MPLCPQVTNTPITVTQTADFTVSSVLPGDVPPSTGDMNTAIQTSANGKNKITYSTSAPGSTANTAGDLWWQYSGSIIIGQWTGAGGTSWTSNTVGNAVIANLDAGKITTGTLDAITITGCTITGGTVQTSTGATSVSMVGSTNAITFKNAGSVVGHIVPLSSNGIIMHYGPTADPTGGTRPQLFVGSGNVSLQASSTHVIGISTAAASIQATQLNISAATAITGTFSATSTVQLDGSVTMGTSNTFQYLSSSGTLRSLYTYGKLVSTTRPLLISSVGDFGTSVSTRRKKHNIESYQIDTNALLQLDVKKFQYLPELDPTQVYVHGFIAEDAHDLGLDELIQYDSDGLPDYFAYDKLPIFLLQLVQAQEARIKALENK